MVTRVGSDNFEILRDEALFGIAAVKAYLQLPRHERDKIGNIIEDKTPQPSVYIDLPPEIEAIQHLVETPHDLSPDEQLVLLEYTLLGTREAAG
jgi:hypothetical protein